MRSAQTHVWKKKENRQLNNRIHVNTHIHAHLLLFRPFGKLLDATIKNMLWDFRALGQLKGIIYCVIVVVCLCVRSLISLDFTLSFLLFIRFIFIIPVRWCALRVHTRRKTTSKLCVRFHVYFFPSNQRLLSLFRSLFICHRCRVIIIISVRAQVRCFPVFLTITNRT